MPTSRRASAHGACRDVQPRVTPSASSRWMVPSPHTSARDVTSAPPLKTVKSGGQDAIPGRNARAFPPPHQTDAPGRRVPSCSLILSIGHKLTTPAGHVTTYLPSSAGSKSTVTLYSFVPTASLHFIVFKARVSSTPSISSP